MGVGVCLFAQEEEKCKEKGGSYLTKGAEETAGSRKIRQKDLREKARKGRSFS
jgi:hypothetical protein